MTVDQLIELLPALIAGLIPSMMTAIPSIIALIKNIKLEKAQLKMESLIQTAEFGLGAITNKLEALEKKYAEEKDFTINEAREAIVDMKNIAKELVNEIKQDLDFRVSQIESEMNKNVDEVHE